MLGVSAAVRENTGLQGGDEFVVELELDTQPREVILPPDFKKALDKDYKGKISPLLYVLSLAIAFKNPWVSIAIYIFVALMWIVPDKRIERIFAAPSDT